jgi:anti-anti-sigma factor
VRNKETKNMNTDIILSIRNASLKGQEVKSLRKQLKSLVAPGRTVVLQMAGVQHVDAEGAGAILEFARKLRSNGGSLRIANIEKKVAAFFEMLQLNRAVEIYATQSDAVQVALAA